jgi:APA family basic amino acid/polyamine antiporter
MGGVVIAVLAIYTFLPAVALSAMPVENGSTELADKYAGDPILGVVENMELGALQHPVEIYVGILAATILFIATNAGLIGVSRLSYSMGQYRQLPEGLRRLHPKFRTPYVAIIVFGFVACLTIVPGQAEFLGTVYAFGAMLSFTIAHAAVIGLRITQPDAERPWTGPGNVRIGGRSIPLFAVFGGLGTGIAFVVVSALELSTLAFGAAWLLMGVLLYVWYRHNQGLALTQTVKAVQPKAIVEREVEYESVLVAFEDGHYDPEAIATAVKLAARRRRGIHVLVTITVPSSAPIDAALPEDESRAQEAIDSARVLGGRRVTGHWEKVRRGEAGRRIVDDAELIQARAIVMSLRRRRSGAPDLGRTLEYVLAHRPCRVVVSAQPASAGPGPHKGESPVRQRAF